jgi:hypothetical protein
MRTRPDIGLVTAGKQAIGFMTRRKQEFVLKTYYNMRVILPFFFNDISS